MFLNAVPRMRFILNLLNFSSFRISLTYCVKWTVLNVHNKSTIFKQGISYSALLLGGKKDNLGHVLSNKKKTNSPSKTVVSHLEQYADYYNLESIPNKYLRKVKRAEGLFIVSNDVARTVAKKVSSNFSEDGVPLFEVNPGIGLLTKALLESGIQTVNVLQSQYWDAMHDFLNRHASRVCLYEYDFFSFWANMLVYIQDRNENIKKIIATIESKNWSDGPVMRIIAAVPKKRFFSQLIGAVIFQKGIFVYGRAEFYLMMQPYDYFHFTSSNKDDYVLYTYTSVLFQILFETSLMSKLPRKDFLPWEQSTNPNKRKHPRRKVDEDYLYLVKVMPRQNLFEVIGGIENLQPFWHFVRQCLSSRRKKVIPTLERWIPGCGPRLLIQGMTIFTEFGEMSPSQIVNLFLEFTQWPDYEKSSFLPSMQTQLLKMYVDANKDEEAVHDLEALEASVDYECESEISNAAGIIVHKY